MEGRGCVGHIFTLRLMLQKCLSHQTPLVFSFIDYEQAVNSGDRRALVKVLSLYGIPDKHIKVTIVCMRIKLRRLRFEMRLVAGLY